ncbi:hypothetical protein [Hydrogenophaga sp.]|uniref:hypothetical protein n=1 Tax=Hydrogenophaga sp. TaxID=1904254 RepID=UPI0025BEDBBC|nr:hypothetical protein [Hydrogenophaga sp.]MBT9463026.1 hypothetical protein [Hydrogenophaga sp.]
MNQESSEYFRVPNPGDFAGLASPDRASARHAELADHENAVPEWVTQARRSIRDNPLGAVATALAAGVLFSRLMR